MGGWKLIGNTNNCQQSHLYKKKQKMQTGRRSQTQWKPTLQEKTSMNVLVNWL